MKTYVIAARALLVLICMFGFLVEGAEQRWDCAAWAALALFGAGEGLYRSMHN